MNHLRLSAVLSWGVLGIFTFLVMLILGQSVLALSDSDLDSIYRNTVFYKSNDSGDGGLCGPSDGGPLLGPQFPQVTDTNQLASRIKEYITANKPASGLKDISNDIVTLGKQYDVNPALLIAVGIKETGLGTDGGIGNPPQYNFWGARGSGDSWQTFASYRESVEDYYKNLRTNSAYAKVWAKGITASVDDIIYVASPPSENDTPAYVEFVRSTIHKILDGLTPSNAASAQATITTTCNGNGIVSADGYAFPVAPQTKSGNGGVAALSALPCKSSSCHHDGSPAFDIGRQPGGDGSAGAPVYAISDGTVDMVHVYQQITGCYSLQFRSSKDNFWYWYGHIQNVKVSNGQTVKAGTQIAEVGLRKCTGNGSSAHLHIDRGCVVGGVPQKGGRVECRDQGMIAVINALWETLPQ